MPRRTLFGPDSLDDMAHGQNVIISARWILVIAGMALALWNPAELVQLQIAIVVILGLAIGNFALHTQVLKRGPVLPAVIYAASVADLVAISALIVAGGGIPAAPYVFYLPALLAIAVTFRTEVTVLYTWAAASAYGVIALATGTADDLLPVLSELLVLVAVPVCGNVYWRLERDRRRTVVERPEEGAASADSAASERTATVPAPRTYAAQKS